MAQVNLTKEWSALDVTTGTIQNLSAAYNIEVSEDNTDGSGQVLYPKEALSFSGVQLYARVVATSASAKAQVRVSPFADAVGGSGGGGGSATPYVLPTASATLKGGIKVGTTLTIDGNGVLDAIQPTPYTLPPATKTSLGGVKVGNNLTVAADGTINAVADAYTLPTASATEKGGVKVGDGLKMTGEVLGVDTGITAGKIVKVGTNGKIDSGILPAIATGNTYVEASEAAMLALSAAVGDICVRSDESKSYILQKAPASTLANWVYLQSPTAAVQSVNGKTGTVVIDVPTKVSELTNDAGYIATVPTASASTAGIVKVGAGLAIDSNGVLTADGSLPTASATTKGGVKIGAGLTMTGEVLSADAQAKATYTTLGGIIVGDNLTIDTDGKLSANPGSYTLPTADASTLGGVKVGDRLSIDADGKLSATDQTAGLATVATTGKYTDLTDTPAAYVLPTATAAIKGGVKIGSNVDVDGNGVISVADADGTTAGIAKLYTAIGENTDGAMSQKAVKDALDTKVVKVTGKGLSANDYTDTDKAEVAKVANKLDASDYKLTDLIDDTTASTSTVYSSSKVDTKLGGYLPLSGGVMTVKDIISRNVDDSAIQIMSATSYEKGAYIKLNGQDSAENAGFFSLTARDATNGYKQLIGKPDGTLTWGGECIYRNADNSILVLCGGSTISTGARLDLVGSNNPDDAIKGVFGLHAINGDDDCCLVGTSYGTLIWGGKEIKSMAFPSNTILSSITVPTLVSGWNENVYTTPANGFVYIEIMFSSATRFIVSRQTIDKGDFGVQTIAGGVYNISIPAAKGDKINIYVAQASAVSSFSHIRFCYAQGEV